MKKQQQPRNVHELRDALTSVWNGVEKEVLKKLIDSVPNRLNEALRMKRYPTRY
jgi:hypothetical protein